MAGRNDNDQRYNYENRPPQENENPDRKDDVTTHTGLRDGSDVHDSKRDQERLRSEETTIDLPNVNDIPGQEFVHAPLVGMVGDTTISSGDEEGEGIFEEESSEDDGLDIRMGTDADVSRDEREALRDGFTYMPTRDEDNLHDAKMDNVDFENTPLNERSFGEVQSGTDLDFQEETDETRNTAMGQGDEENKYYSLGGADNDDVTEGTP
ncbi:MAG: hypothetical protein C4330_05055 [Chitinophagaceae bacterium]